MAKQPNILLILTDDQRFDTIGAVNNPAIKTPNLDRLVADGTTCTHAHIMGGSSAAICMPSRAMLHTGRTLYHLAAQGQTIPDDHVTLGEALQRAGYDTFGTGKWHNGIASFARSFTDGDEIYFGGMMDHWNVPAHRYDPSGEYSSQMPYCVDAFRSKEVSYRHADHIHAGVHSTDMLTDATLAYLDRRPADKPFFAYVSYLAPHDPRVMPQKYLDMYDPDEIELPVSYMPSHPFDNGELRIRDEMLAGFPRAEEEVREHLRDYYAMITHVDDRLGDLLDKLEAEGELENTIIIFTGDNGLAVGRHGLMGKQSMYDHSMRVPMIWRGPGVPKGEQRDGLCYVLDIMPTLLAMVGSDIPETVEGRSLKPMIDGETGGREFVQCAYRHIQRAVSDGKFKLIEYVVHGRRRTQLFDLTDDPHELTNLADEPAQADRLRTMRGWLETWRTEWDDDQPDQGATFWAGYDAAS